MGAPAFDGVGNPQSAGTVMEDEVHRLRRAFGEGVEAMWVESLEGGDPKGFSLSSRFGFGMVGNWVEAKMLEFTVTAEVLVQG